MNVAPTPTPMSPAHAADGIWPGNTGRPVAMAATQYTQAVAVMMIATATVADPACPDSSATDPRRSPETRAARITQTA